MSYYNYDDEQFYEPTGYEEQLGALVTQIRSNIKSEVIHELETLRAENAKLQNIKQRMSDIDREHLAKVQELEFMKRDALSIVRREKLHKLLEELHIEIYSPTSYTELGPKCDQCDDKRRRHYVTPLGKNSSESCECEVKFTKYKVKEEVVCEFSNRDNKLRIWYKQYPGSDDTYTADNSKFFDGFNDEKPYEEIERYWRAFFKDKDKCLAYCEWLNEQERIKEEPQ